MLEGWVSDMAFSAVVYHVDPGIVDAGVTVDSGITGLRCPPGQDAIVSGAVAKPSDKAEIVAEQPVFEPSPVFAPPLAKSDSEDSDLLGGESIKLEEKAEAPAEQQASATAGHNVDMQQMITLLTNPSVQGFMKQMKGKSRLSRGSSMSPDKATAMMEGMSQMLSMFGFSDHAKQLSAVQQQLKTVMGAMAAAQQ